MNTYQSLDVMNSSDLLTTPSLINLFKTSPIFEEEEEGRNLDKEIHLVTG